ncbi:sulfatase [Arenibacter sp. F26102]|uniref:sulfatase n=1 Tax=Arenibacter sp. F26102 TaxID=2926416 RepID=UPI001FF3D926|nr:sulfatase [Arenibacter sp. F26102]MCK0148280.1 sulfatase [Arenibacter sp. F26102]
MIQKIKISGIFFLGFYICCSLEINAQKQEKSNVLVVIYDDLNDWILHPEGHPRSITPNMDRLRGRSTNFTNAHAVVPVCGASRASILSGLSPQVTGLWSFGEWQKNMILANSVSLPLHFRNNGYDVYGVGKILHEGSGGDFYTEYGKEPDYGPWPWKGKGDAFYCPKPSQYKKWIPYMPEVMHRDLNYAPLSSLPIWEVDKNIPGASGWFNQRLPEEELSTFKYVSDSNREKMPDEESTDWAINILNQKHSKPFFLTVGYIRPHTPLYVPKKYFEMFPIDKITLPPYKKNDLDDCAKVLRDRWQWGYIKFDVLLKAGGEKDWKEWVQAYLASVAFADDQLGKLMESMDANGYWDNTIVVMTSDHGYHVGEKNVIQKWHLWNESTRVPFFVSIPQNKGKGFICNKPISLIDIYPTLVDLCQIPINPNKGKSNLPLNGRSLSPLLMNPNSPNWNSSVALMGVKDQGQAPNFSVVSDRYRYTLCNDGEEELYDHVKDPNEWINLAKDTRYGITVGQLRNEMERIVSSIDN